MIGREKAIFVSVRMAPEGRQLALLSDKVKVTQAEIKSPLGQNALQTKRLPTGVLSIPPPSLPLNKMTVCSDFFF